MSKLFYNYIIKDLLIGWFKQNPPLKGSRYYLVIENNEHRDSLLDAIKAVSEDITINGIYEGSDVPEENYKTCALKISSNLPDLIIGDDKTASEDYLTTLRNSVGQNGKYENYGVLYILSTNVLSSLATASSNLEDIGMPLHPKQVVDCISQDINGKISKDLERIYLTKHLESVSEQIADGVSSLFDFESIMAVLEAETIRGLFNSLDMFEDNTIYDNIFKPTDSEMKNRALHNRELYARIYSIMNDDEEDKTLELERFLDEKLSKKIAKNKETWAQIDLQDLLESEARKAQTDNLKLVNVSLQNPISGAEVIWEFSGKLDKTSKNYIVICDPTPSSYQEVILLFNKPLKADFSTGDNFKIRGNQVVVKVEDAVFAKKIGNNDNHHDFFITRLNCTPSFFRDIKPTFSLNKKGDFTIKVPDEATELHFGDGSEEGILSIQNEWVWNENETLTIPVDEDDEEEKFFFTVNFGDKTSKVTLKLNSAKPVPPLGPDSFPPSAVLTGIELNGEPFKKVTDGETVRPVFGYWRKYLNWEQNFIANECHHLRIVHNDLTGVDEIVPVSLEIPGSIKVALRNIYGYFKDKDSIPSLCPIDQSLQILYRKYCDVVTECVSAIPTTKSLDKEYHNLTLLGTVYDGEHFYLSPFHPMMISYMLEYAIQSRGDYSTYAKRLLTPFYLIPYLTYKGEFMRPYSNNKIEDIRNWLMYEKENSKPQDRANDITTKMVSSKMEDFIKNFPYLFQDKESPIVISSIGINDDSNLVKGIVEFIKAQFTKGVQRIELHEYVDDLGREMFFEKLNRLDSIDNIERELRSMKIDLESRGDYTSKDIIHQLFTRVDFYKLQLSKANPSIQYCHIAFYQMATGSSYVTPPSDEARTELAFNGLISIPSTLRKNGAYQIGFGMKSVNPNHTDGFIHPMAIAYNNLYGNEKNDGANTYTIPTAVTKRFEFKNSALLDSIYSNANWVTFLNPEVDINFFYKQDVYVVHYTDQYTINAKYDSITVTKHIGLYNNLLKKSYEQYALPAGNFPEFNKTMKNYFNCLNGRWLLRLVNQPELKVREKMSLVATSIVMQKLLQRNQGIIWIPISLEEILRVTGEIGLKMDGIFSKKALGAKGIMSDDLLMIGLDSTNPARPILYFYPVEVKVSNSTSHSDKGGAQVAHTWTQFKNHLFINNDSFQTKIHRTFFASQLLTNAEKLFANDLLSDEHYESIECCRYALLNLKWEVKEVLPVKELGAAAVISFFSTASHSITTSVVENVPVCEIHFPQKECFEAVANPAATDLDFLSSGIIDIDADALALVNEPLKIGVHQVPQTEIAVDVITDEEDDNANTVLPSKEKSTEEDSISEIQSSSDNPAKKKKTNTDGNNSTTQEDNLNSVKGQTSSPIRIVVGSIKNKAEEVVFEPNNTKVVTHPNMGIIGTMGTGKTQFARSVIAQFSRESAHNVGATPIGLLVFDYKGDYKDKEFVNTVNGQCYKTNYPFNPLKLVINDEVEGMNLPAITADRIADSFAKAYGLGLKQQSNIKQVIIATYEDAGITRDPSTWEKQCPTMTDVIEKYFETYDANDKAYALFDKLNDYTIFRADASKCVSMFEWLNGVRVIDLTLYPDDTKKVIVSLILDLFYAEMRQLGGSKQENGLRELRAMILVDEAHQFLKKDFNSFRSIISEGRMFGVGMILSTQNISDFKTAKEDYSQFILSWIIHHVNSITKTELASIFGATDSHLEQYMDYISKAQLFESISKIGHQVNGIRDLPYFRLVQEDSRFTDTTETTNNQ